MSCTFVNGLENFKRGSKQNVIATVGTFDGIHLGHQAIFSLVRQQSIETGSDAVLVTFQPHPRTMTTPANIPLLLTTIEEKEQFVPDFFDGTVLILEFNAELMQMSAEEFVLDILVDKIGLNKLIVGYDHALGRDRSGNIAHLRKLGVQSGFEVEVVEPVIVDGEAVSSSRIRRAIADNRFREAIKLLGHEYAIYGTVERGIGLGKQLGYPTANVRYNHRKLLPQEGVYACWSIIEGVPVEGMMFIGRNHFNPADRVSVEANLFDFSGDLYDKEITVFPTHFMRENRRFDSIDALKAQIAQDKIDVMRIRQEENQKCR